MSRILVYHANPGRRFQYIATYFVEELCGLGITITSDAAELGDYDGPAICYDQVRLSEKALHIKPSGLLEQAGIVQQEIEMGRWQDLPCFFLTDGDVPFDMFSAAFYLITRYEEYLPYQKDMYGRYSHSNSIAYRNHFLEVPVLDLWALELKNMLGVRKADMIPGKRVFRFIPSYDIDMAWCFLHKGFLRNAGGLIRDLLGGNFKQAGKRFDVLNRKRPDPFDVYEWLDALHLRYGLKPFYFFLLANNNSEYDKNISPGKKAMRELVSYHASGYFIGIHPSWRSRNDERIFLSEISQLAGIIGSPVVRSRFHYIAFNIPDGYRKLIKNEIPEDHSMGYGSINGFRASVSTPFPWYDLEKEEMTELMVHPFCWMDANSYYEQQYTPAQAFAELKYYHDIVKKAGGQLSTISHNNFFSDEPGFAGWKEVYEIFLDEVVYWDI